MSDQEKESKQGLVKSYLGFIDTNVIFKKPVSFLFAIISLMIPVYSLIQFIQVGLFESEIGKLITAAILILAVLFFAGIFGALIWWHRRIIRDEGPKVYNNFRRFIQTMSEWSATVFAIVVFFGVLIAVIFLGNDARYIARAFPLPLPAFDAATCLAGPVGGFLIIIATKIFLFLLDPVIWLIRQLWNLLVRVVLYFYRCVIKVHATFEQNTPVWIGVIWLVSMLVTACGLLLGFYLFEYPEMEIFLGAIFTLALGLGLMAFLVVKRKNYDA